MSATRCICLTGVHGAWSPSCPVHGTPAPPTLTALLVAIAETADDHARAEHVDAAMTLYVAATVAERGVLIGGVRRALDVAVRGEQAAWRARVEELLGAIERWEQEDADALEWQAGQRRGTRTGAES